MRPVSRFQLDGAQPIVLGTEGDIGGEAPGGMTEFGANAMPLRPQAPCALTRSPSGWRTAGNAVSCRHGAIAKRSILAPGRTSRVALPGHDRPYLRDRPGASAVAAGLARHPVGGVDHTGGRGDRACPEPRRQCLRGRHRVQHDGAVPHARTDARPAAADPSLPAPAVDGHDGSDGPSPRLRLGRRRFLPRAGFLVLSPPAARAAHGGHRPDCRDHQLCRAADAAAGRGTALPASGHRRGARGREPGLPRGAARDAGRHAAPGRARGPGVCRPGAEERAAILAWPASTGGGRSRPAPRPPSPERSGARRRRPARLRRPRWTRGHAQGADRSRTCRRPCHRRDARQGAGSPGRAAALPAQQADEPRRAIFAAGGVARRGQPAGAPGRARPRDPSPERGRAQGQEACDTAHPARSPAGTAGVAAGDAHHARSRAGDGRRHCPVARSLVLGGDHRLCAVPQHALARRHDLQGRPARRRHHARHRRGTGPGGSHQRLADPAGGAAAALL